MKPWIKGILIALLHCGLVASLGGKLLYDRASQPRGWAQAAPYDPNLPIRGRYVSLQLAVEPRGIGEAKTGSGWQSPQQVVLRVQNGRVVAEPGRQDRRFNASAPRLRFIQRQNEKIAVLDKPVSFFIQEHVADPSHRAPGEELWVEVTIPKKGPPRPIRLGVSKDKGPIIPLDLS